MRLPLVTLAREPFVTHLSSRNGHCLGVTTLVPTTMSSLPNELWWEVLAHAISLEINLAMVKPSSESLHPFFPGGVPGFSDEYFYYSQLAKWKCSITVAHNLVQVNRLWRGIAEQFLYSAFYVEEAWRVQRFIDTIKLNPNLAKQLHTLVIMPRRGSRGVVRQAGFEKLVIQVLSLCHDIDSIVIDSNISSIFHSPNFSRRLLLLSAPCPLNEGFPTFLNNFNNYASLQVLELSVEFVYQHMLPSRPELIAFPSLHTLILGYLHPLALNVVGKWELPSLKELSIPLWHPLSSTALLPLIQRSYDKLEFFSASADLLHDRAFYDIIQAPPVHLRNLTINYELAENESPPMHPAIKLFLCHVVTLGIGQIGVMLLSPGAEAAWDQFFSDSTYAPRLRSVLTSATAGGLILVGNIRRSHLPGLHALDERLKDRGVAFQGVTDDNSTFVPIKLLCKKAFEVRISCLVMDRCSFPHQR
jgi:hypothetical protein